MSEFLVQVIQSKKEYIESVKKEGINKKYIYIYGAGRVATPIFEILSKNNVDITGFCVTDKSMNVKEICEKPVLQADEIKSKESETLFLVGTQPEHNEIISKKLHTLGYSNIVKAPELIRYFGDFLGGLAEKPIMEITTKLGCKIRCRFCPQETLYQRYFETGGEETELTYERYYNCLDKLPLETIIWFAGFSEPFLNSECEKMILYAHEKGHAILLYTTLVGMHIENFEAIKNIPFLEVVVHLPDDDKYADIPITQEYLDLLDIMLDAKKINGTPFVDWTNCQSVPNKEVLRHIEGKTRFFTELTDRAGNLSGDNLRSRHDIQGKIRCRGANNWNHNVLLPDGRIVLCAQDYGLKHILGNLSAQSYNEIMNGTEIKKIQESCTEKIDYSILCRNCSHACNI